MTPDHKAAILQHLLKFARIDPEAAIHAAGWYEAGQPYLLANLQAKVRQEARRAERDASLPVAGPDAEPQERPALGQNQRRQG
jgi:hypothetical protein